MKILLYTLMLTAAITAPLRAQKISNVDFDAIRRATADTGSSYFYPRLWRCFMRFDPVLDQRALTHLYYGYVYRPEYKPVNPSLIDSEQVYAGYVKAGRRTRAAAAAMALVKADPLNLKYINEAGLSLLATGDTASALKYRRRWEGLVKLILASGDGRSDSTAYVVIHVPDEYQVMGFLGYTSTMHTFRGSPGGKRRYTDVFDLKPNISGRDTIYFNTNWSYWYLSNTVEPEQKGAE